MKVLREGKTMKPRWHKKVICNGLKRIDHCDSMPCMTKYRVDVSDVVMYYGGIYFICPKCGCSTYICNSEGLKKEVCSLMPRIAQDYSNYYSDLSDFEKKLSAKIFN